jgi:transposase-like protein
MTKQERAEAWRGHLESWHKSGLTQVAYCRQHGISIKTFHRWRRKEKEAQSTTPSTLTLVPVSVTAQTTDAVLRLRSPAGWHIELPMQQATGQTAWLADLVRGLP